MPFSARRLEGGEEGLGTKCRKFSKGRGKGGGSIGQLLKRQKERAGPSRKSS